MPDIPFPLPQSVPESRGLPRMNTFVESPLTGLGETLQKATAILDDIYDEQKKQQDALEFAQLQADFDNELRVLDENVRESEPDFQKREEAYRVGATKLAADFTKRTNSAQVRNALQIHMARQLPQKIFDFRLKNQAEWNQDKLARLDQLEETLSTQIVESNDPDEAMRHRGIYRSVVESFTRGAYPALSADKAEARIQAFEQKIVEKRGLRIIRESPETFLAVVDSDSTFKTLPMDKRLKLAEIAQNKIKQQDEARDKLAKKVREAAWRSAVIQANLGRLTPEIIEEGLRGDSNVLSPDDWRQLQQINNNPPSSQWDAQVGAIMQDYYSGTVTAGRIGRARAALAALARQTDRPSKALAQAFRTLQNDEQELEGMNAARINRAIKDAWDEYESLNKPPFSSPFFTAREQKDKAAIARDIRRGKDPKDIVNKRTQRNKAQDNALSEEEKAIRGNQ